MHDIENGLLIILEQGPINHNELYQNWKYWNVKIDKKVTCVLLELAISIEPLFFSKNREEGWGCPKRWCHTFAKIDLNRFEKWTFDGLVRTYKSPLGLTIITYDERNFYYEKVS